MHQIHKRKFVVMMVIPCLVATVAFFIGSQKNVDEVVNSDESLTNFRPPELLYKPLPIISVDRSDFKTQFDRLKAESYLDAFVESRRLLGMRHVLAERDMLLQFLNSEALNFNDDTDPGVINQYVNIMISEYLWRKLEGLPRAKIGSVDRILIAYWKYGIEADSETKDLLTKLFNSRGNELLSDDALLLGMLLPEVTRNYFSSQADEFLVESFVQEKISSIGYIRDDISDSIEFRTLLVSAHNQDEGSVVKLLNFIELMSTTAAAISYEYLSVLDGSPEVELFLIRKSFSDEITGTENTPSDVIRSPIAIAAVRALEDMHFHTLAPIENDLRVMPHLNGRKWIRDHFSEAKLRAAGVHIE